MSDNEIIAEFMGGLNNDPYTRRIGLNIPHLGNQWYDISDLKYDKSWDWLMPVVDKIYRLDDGIKQLGVQVMIKNSRCVIAVDKKRFSSHTISPLNSTYNAVIQFIHWYNAEKL